MIKIWYSCLKFESEMNPKLCLLVRLIKYLEIIEKAFKSMLKFNLWEMLYKSSCLMFWMKIALTLKLSSQLKILDFYLWELLKSKIYLLMTTIKSIIIWYFFQFLPVTRLFSCNFNVIFKDRFQLNLLQNLLRTTLIMEDTCFFWKQYSKSSLLKIMIKS